MAQENEQKEGLTTLFKISIPDAREMTFKSCEGIEAEVEVVYFPEGGNLGAPRTGRGPQKTSRITFGQGAAAPGGKGIFDWFNEVSDSSKPLQKKTISVKVTDAEGNELAQWRILNAWPCRWMAPMMTTDISSVTVDMVSFAHEGISREK